MGPGAVSSRVIDARSSTHTCCCCCTQVVQINLGAPGGGGPQATCVSVAPPTQARLHSAAALGAMGAMDSGLHSAATWAAVGLSDGAVRLFRLDSLACVAKVPLVVQLCVRSFVHIVLTDLNCDGCVG